MLEKKGIRCILAKDGEEALHLVQKTEEIDIVFMDIQMPVLDGVSATKRIRMLKSEALNRIPIIALTANARESQKEEFIEVGMNGYLTKPYDKKEIFMFLKASFPAKVSSISKNDQKLKDAKVSKRGILKKQAYIFNLESLKEMFGEDPDLIKTLLVQYKTEFSEQIESLQQIIQKEDFNELSGLVHKIKPAVSYLNLNPLSTLFESRKKAEKDIASERDFTKQTLQFLEQTVGDINTYLNDV